MAHIGEGTTRHSRERRAALLAALMLTAACQGATGAAIDEPSAAPITPTTAPTAPKPSASPVDAKDEVLVHYRAFWDALPKASRLPEDQANALLEQYLVDPALTKIEGTLASQRAFDRRLYGANTPRPTSVDVTGDQATVVDCQKSDAAGVEDAKTGERLTVGPARNPVTATLQRSGSSWLIATITYGTGDC